MFGSRRKLLKTVAAVGIMQSNGRGRCEERINELQNQLAQKENYIEELEYRINQLEQQTCGASTTVVDDFEDGTTVGWNPAEELNSTFTASQERSLSGAWSAKFSEGNTAANPVWENVGNISQPDRVETAHTLENGNIYSDTNTEWKMNGDTILRINYNWSNGFLSVNASGGDPEDIENGAVVADLPWPSSDSFFHIVLDDIDWESNEVGQVRVNGAQQAEEVPFFNDANGIERTTVRIGGDGGNIVYIDDTTVPE